MIGFIDVDKVCLAELINVIVSYVCIYIILRYGIEIMMKIIIIYHDNSN